MSGNEESLNDVAAELDAAISRIRWLVASVDRATPVLARPDLSAMNRIWVARQELVEIVVDMGRVTDFLVGELRALVGERLAEDALDRSRSRARTHGPWLSTEADSAASAPASMRRGQADEVRRRCDRVLHGRDVWSAARDFSPSGQFVVIDCAMLLRVGRAIVLSGMTRWPTAAQRSTFDRRHG